MPFQLRTVDHRSTWAAFTTEASVAVSQRTITILQELKSRQHLPLVYLRCFPVAVFPVPNRDRWRLLSSCFQNPSFQPRASRCSHKSGPAQNSRQIGRPKRILTRNRERDGARGIFIILPVVYTVTKFDPIPTPSLHLPSQSPLVHPPSRPYSRQKCPHPIPKVYKHYIVVHGSQLD